MAKIEPGACVLQEKEKMGPAWRGCCYGSLSSLSNARHAVWWGWQFNWLGDAQYVGFFGGSFPNDDITHASSTIFCSVFNSGKQCSCSYCAKDQSGHSFSWIRVLQYSLLFASLQSLFTAEKGTDVYVCNQKSHLKKIL